jgi:hypothetical protein
MWDSNACSAAAATTVSSSGVCGGVGWGVGCVCGGGGGQYMLLVQPDMCQAAYVWAMPPPHCVVLVCLRSALQYLLMVQQHMCQAAVHVA